MRQGNTYAVIRGPSSIARLTDHVNFGLTVL